MNQKFAQYVNAVRQYPDFKAQFSDFCETSSKILNNNEHLQGTSFNADSDGITAKIGLLDQIFIVMFHLVALDEYGKLMGVLGVYLPIYESKESLLWQAIFDNYGNVKDTLDAPTAFYSLRDKEFVKKLLGELTEKYFSHLVETLKLSDMTTPKQQG